MTRNWFFVCLKAFEFEHWDLSHTIFVSAKVAFLNLGYFDASRFYWDPRMKIWHCRTGLKGTKAQLTPSNRTSHSDS